MPFIGKFLIKLLIGFSLIIVIYIYIYIYFSLSDAIYIYIYIYIYIRTTKGAKEKRTKEGLSAKSAGILGREARYSIAFNCRAVFALSLQLSFYPIAPHSLIIIIIIIIIIILSRFFDLYL